MEIWEEFFHKHKGDELCILVLESCRILLRKGEMTAENVHHIPVSNPNIRGALMKHLKRLGLVEKSAIYFGSTKQSHGHNMFKWRLTDPAGAEWFLNKAKGMVLNAEPKKKVEVQMKLL